VLYFRGCQRKNRKTLRYSLFHKRPANQKPETEVSPSTIFSTGCVETQLLAEWEFCASRNWLYTWSTVIAQGGPGEIQNPSHWNLIGRSMTAPAPVIAQQYSSAPSPHNVFIPARRNSARVWKILFHSFAFLKLCACKIT
jgi:hypothetical protein